MKIRSLLCALCILCGSLPSWAAPLISIMATTNSNHTVTVPKYNLVWPTQTNLFHKATITNLTVSAITGVDATEVAVADVANNFSTNTVEAALLELANDLGALGGDLTEVQVSGGLLSVSSGTGPIPNVGLTTSAVRSATAIYLPLSGGTMTGPLNIGGQAATNASRFGFSAGPYLALDGMENLTIASPGNYTNIVITSETGTIDPSAQIAPDGATAGQVLTFDGLAWGPGSLTAYLQKSGGTMTGILNMGDLAITNVNRIVFDPIGSSTRPYLSSSGTDTLMWTLPGSFTQQVYTSSTGLIPVGDLAQSGASLNQVPVWNGSEWAPGTISAGIGGSTGSTDNLALRADGTGGSTVQGSDLVIGDASTSTANNLLLSNNHSGQSNSAFGISPKGTGGFFLGPAPDATSTGGNARGAYAVDLQISRNAANQVPGGTGSVIGGGARNRAVSNYSAVSSGFANTAGLSNDYAWIGGGLNNDATEYATVVGGGDDNTASGNRSAVVGGRQNTASGANSFVGGGGTGSAGFGNTASGTGSGILGGSENSATQSYSAVGGGQLNNATAAHSVAVGGYDNDPSGAYSSALGGLDSDPSGPYSSAQGLYARATLHGQEATASGRFSASGDAQRSTLKMFRSITGTAATELFLDGATLQADMGTGNRVWLVCAEIVGTVNTVGNGTGGIAVGDSGVFMRSLGIKRIGSDGGTALIGSVQTMGTDQADANFAGAAVTFSADTATGSLKLTATAPTLAGSSTVVRWAATLYLTEITP